MRAKHVYLVLAAVGAVVPYYFLISFLTTHGVDGREFVRELFATPISTFFAADLLISCLVFVRFLRQEAARYSIGNWRVFLLALVTVGLSFALPLFLYVREGYVEAGRRAANE